MKKFLMLITAMFCILCGALAFAACGETNGLGDVVVKSVQVDERGHLTVTYSDGTVKDLGEFEPSAQTGTEGLQYQKRKDEAGNEYAAVVGLGTAWDTDVVIPAVYRGLPVKEIANRAFYASYDARNASITSVVIPDSVTEIGDYAFCGCNGLTLITIPDGLTSIGQGAFNGCGGLEEITIPASVSSIRVEAFDNCIQLKNAYFENPNGWSANGEPISGLEDPATAAQYLTNLNHVYGAYSWERID